VWRLSSGGFSSSDGEASGVDAGVARLDDGDDASFPRSDVAFVGLVPRSFLVTLEFCALTEGGVTVDGVRGAR